MNANAPIPKLSTLETAELKALFDSKKSLYESYKAQKTNLDLTRGKPSAEQLSLSDDLDGILQGNYTSDDGVDTRNYGGLEGLSDARAFGAKLLDMPVDNVFAQGNSSLTLMHQAMMTGYLFGFDGPESAWIKRNNKIKFICPVPGYDRHFSVCEHFGIEMVTVPMTSTGPDMDVVEKLVAVDTTIVGMWCVPKYSNPTGVIYDDATVLRIAELGSKASNGFRVFWDNAYSVHDLADTPLSLKPIWPALEKANTEDSVLQFASTSKITHAGAGVAFLGASKTNLAAFKKALSFLTIGPDKVNQLRHVRFFKQHDLQEHMRRHASILKPRFNSVLSHLDEAFGKNSLGSWERPDGGYFIAFDTQPGCAKRVVALAKEAGVKLTPAGATFPYGHDPEDRNIRIAPSVPTLAEVDSAMKIFVTCVELATLERALM